MFSCDCKNNRVTEDDIYKAMSDIIDSLENEAWVNDGSPEFLYILDKSFSKFNRFSNVELLFNDKKISAHFCENDKFAFIEQLKWHDNFYFNEEKIKQKKVLERKKLDEILSSNPSSFWDNYILIFGDFGFYDISIPLFSENKLKLLVSVEKCLPYSSGGAIFLFEKIEGVWQVKDILYSFT